MDLSRGWGKKNEVGLVFSAGSLFEMQSQKPVVMELGE